MSNFMEDANAQVRRLVQRVLGLPDGYMRPANQSADAGHQGVPFGTVLVMSPTQAGTVARSIDQDDAGNLTEDLQVATVFTASVQFFKSTPRPASLRGALASQTLSDYTGVTDGGFDISIDGINRQVIGLDFHAVASLDDVASVVQAGLVALLAGVTVAWTGKRFTVTSPIPGSNSAVSPAVAPTGSGPPVDVSMLLALTVSAGASPQDNATQIAKWNLDALDLARRLKMLLESGVHGVYMQLAGLGFLHASNVRELSGIADGAWESRASIDLIFNAIAREEIPVASIEPPFMAGIKAQSPDGAIHEVDISVTPP